MVMVLCNIRSGAQPEADKAQLPGTHEWLRR
jgi:hypothetical protein